MSLVNSVLPVTNAKDSRWLTLEVCREYQRNKCSRSENECKFAHPPAHVEVNNGRVVCCFDSLKNRCNRTDPPCKYLHPPPHLRDQLLQNGRNNLILKNIQMGMLQQALLHQSGLLPIGPYMPLAATASNLPQHPYVGGGASPFLGGASPIPLLSPAPGGEPGLLTAASPAAAAAAGLTPVVPNNLMGAQAMKLPAAASTTISLVHPTAASPSAANMFGSAHSPHASFVAAAAAAGQQAKMMQERCKADRVEMQQNAYASLQAKNTRSSNGEGPCTAENGIGPAVSAPQASLLAAAAVVSMNTSTAALQQAMGAAAGFQQSNATPPAAALATMQLPTGQQAYIPAHPAAADFASFAPASGHPSAIHRF